MRLFFCHGCQEGQSHLRVFLQGEDALRLKEYANRILQICQVPDNADAVGHISCKTGYVLANDHVEHARFSVCNHLVEVLTMFSLCAAYALISINMNQRPVGMMHNKVLIILLLKLIGRCLFHIVRRNTDVNDHPVLRILIKGVNLFFLRIIHVVIGINLDIHTASGLLFCYFLLPLLFDINHGGNPLLHPDQEVSSSPDME